jgi:hypothetical protein
LHIEEAVMAAFRKEYFKNDKHSDALHGKSIIVKEVLVRYIRIILEKDSKYAPFSPVALEERFKTLVKIGNKQLTVGGVVDRMDIIEDKYRIVDYKTGNVEMSCASVEHYLIVQEIQRNNAAIFQSLLYCHVVRYRKIMQTAHNPGLYALRKIVDKHFDYHLASIRSR